MHPKSLNVIVELLPTRVALLSGVTIMETTSENILSSVESWDPVLEEKIGMKALYPLNTDLMLKQLWV